MKNEDNCNFPSFQVINHFIYHSSVSSYSFLMLKVPFVFLLSITSQWPKGKTLDLTLGGRGFQSRPTLLYLPFAFVYISLASWEIKVENEPNNLSTLKEKCKQRQKE